MADTFLVSGLGDLEAVLRRLTLEQYHALCLAMVEQSIDMSHDLLSQTPLEKVMERIKSGAHTKQAKELWDSVSEDRMWAWLVSNGIVIIQRDPQLVDWNTISNVPKVFPAGGCGGDVNHVPVEPLDQPENPFEKWKEIIRTHATEHWAQAMAAQPEAYAQVLGTFELMIDQGLLSKEGIPFKGYPSTHADTPKDRHQTFQYLLMTHRFLENIRPEVTEMELAMVFNIIETSFPMFELARGKVSFNEDWVPDPKD